MPSASPVAPRDHRRLKRRRPHGPGDRKNRPRGSDRPFLFDWISDDASINRGTLGRPLITLQGRVIGSITSGRWTGRAGRVTAQGIRPSLARQIQPKPLLTRLDHRGFARSPPTWGIALCHAAVPAYRIGIPVDHARRQNTERADQPATRGVARDRTPPAAQSGLPRRARSQHRWEGPQGLESPRQIIMEEAGDTLNTLDQRGQPCATVQITSGGAES